MSESRSADGEPTPGLLPDATSPAPRPDGAGSTSGGDVPPDALPVTELEVDVLDDEQLGGMDLSVRIERYGALAERAEIAREPGVSVGYLWSVVAGAAMDLGRSEEALAYLDRAARAAPEDVDVVLTRAHVLSELGREEEAARVVDALRGRSDLELQHYAAIVDFYQDRGELRRVIRWCSMGLRRHQEDPAPIAAGKLGDLERLRLLVMRREARQELDMVEDDLDREALVRDTRMRAAFDAMVEEGRARSAPRGGGKGTKGSRRRR